MLSQHMTEKCHHREDEVAKMREAMEKSREVISDDGEECTALTNTIATIDKKLEQTKEVCVCCMSELLLLDHIVSAASSARCGLLLECWTNWCTVQKWLNQKSRCHLGAYLCGQRNLD